MKIIDDELYEEYEQLFENAIRLYYIENDDKYILDIWEGYFEIVLNGLPMGIIKKARNSINNWLDDKWKIPDISQVINEFEHIDFNLVESLDTGFSEESLQKVVQKIIKFLTEAKKKNVDVYVDTY